MISIDNIETTHVLRASSVSDLLTIEPSHVNRYHEWYTQRRSSSERNDVFWLGIRGGTAAVERAVKHGWSEGRRRAVESIAQITVPKIKNLKRQKARADAGDHLDMQRVYGGDLERAWETTRRDVGVNIRSQLVTLVVNIGALCNVRAEEMYWRGAAALVACDTLERSGRRVEIIAYNYASQVYPGSEHPTGLTVVKVKAFEDAVNLDQLASTLALAGFFRTYIFIAKLAAPFKASRGLGVTIHQAPSAELLGVARGSEVIHVTDVWTCEAANNFVASLEGTLLA